MSLLIFPDEILIELFDYFYFYEIIYSFYDFINRDVRIRELINNRLRSINLTKIDFRSMTKSQFMFICRFIKSNVNYSEQIHHLILSNRFTFGQIRLFLSQISFEAMSNLKTLTLIQPAPDEYYILFPSKSSHLNRLTIEDPECNDNSRITLIDEMNDLIELTILSNYSVQFRSQYMRLEKLTVKMLNVIDLIGFSTFFPNLHYLDVTLDAIDTDFNKIHIPLLTVLKLRCINVAHDICEKFLLNFLQLRELYYSNTIRCTKKTVIDGHRCQSLIERLPLLETFEVSLHLLNAHTTDICELAASFQSSFYFSKNWNILCESRPNSNDFHIYSVPISLFNEFYTTTDCLVSSTVSRIDDIYANIDHLKLQMTPNWPLATRFFSNVSSLELVQLNHSEIIPSLSIVSYLNKSMFLSNIRKLTLSSPCYFDDSLLRYLLQQSASQIDNLDVPCQYLLRLIRTNILQVPLSIRTLTLRNDYLSMNDRSIFLEYFRLNLNCLSLYLPNNESLCETIVLILDQCQLLSSLEVFTNDSITMLMHVELCRKIQQRQEASAELRPTCIRIWQR